MTTIKLKSGSGAPLASDLIAGEPALDLINKRLYTEDLGGNVIEVGTNPSTLTVDTTTLVVDAGNNRVGVGTASPENDLDVVGSTGIYQRHSSGGRLVFDDVDTADASNPMSFISNVSGTLSFGNADRNPSTGLTTNSSTTMTIASSGNVGIGTTSPKTAVDIVNGTAARIYLGTDASNYGGLVYSSGVMSMRGVGTGTAAVVSADATNSKVTFTTAGVADRMVINSSGNVGIGTANPASLLDIQGAGAAPTSPSVTATTGTNYIGWKSVNTGGSFWTAIDNSTGSAFGTGTAYARTLWSNGAYPMVFSTNSTERMRIDGSGNVGIGTTSPSELLHIAESTGTSTLRSQNNSGSFYFGIDNSTGGTFSTGNYSRVLYSGGAYPMVFATNNAERMRIDSSGNVGIGTASPQSLVHVSASDTSNQVGGSSAAINIVNSNESAFGRTSNLIFSTGSGVTANKIAAVGAVYTSFNTSRAGALTFSTHNDTGTFAERMRIDASGNVGIGTTSPFTAPSQTSLSINGTSYGRIDLYNGGTKHAYMYGGSGNAAIGAYGASVDLAFETNSTERMRIDSSGNLLVGTTAAPLSGVAGVRLSNPAVATPVIGVSGTSFQYMLAFHNANGYVGAITTSSSSTAYNTSSDVRLKENIVDAPAGNIDAIRVRSFDWKADGSHQTYGMIAQELVDVAPEAVSQGETDEDMWGVDYSKLVPMMIKEIQDLRARVAQLEGA